MMMMKHPIRVFATSLKEDRIGMLAILLLLIMFIYLILSISTLLVRLYYIHFVSKYIHKQTLLYSLFKENIIGTATSLLTPTLGSCILSTIKNVESNRILSFSNL
jgi:hypothetical protein